MDTTVQGAETTIAPSATQPYWIFIIGDSKSASPPYTWPLILGQLNNPRAIINSAVSGAGVQTIVNNLSFILSLSNFPGSPVILINLGTDDFSAFNINYGATWIPVYLEIVDGVRIKWPLATFYIARPWMINNDANAVFANTWINTIVASRSGLFLGPDEAVYYKGSDNGASETVDGIHPSVLGETLIANAWQSVLLAAGMK